jgi:hypothetical protein
MKEARKAIARLLDVLDVSRTADQGGKFGKVALHHVVLICLQDCFLWLSSTETLMLRCASGLHQEVSSRSFTMRTSA